MKIQICRKVFEKYSNANFMKISQVGADVFYAERRTDEQLC